MLASYLLEQRVLALMDTRISSMKSPESTRWKTEDADDGECMYLPDEVVRGVCVFDDEVARTSSGLSPVYRHPHLLTHIQNWTRRTKWSGAQANKLAERHEQPVQIATVPHRELFLKGDQGRFRAGGLHVIPTVNDPVDMDVYGNQWLMTGDGERKMGTFWTHTVKREKSSLITGYRAVKLFYCPMRDRRDLLCLGWRKSAGFDRNKDLFRGQHRHCFWSAGQSKQRLSGGKHHFIQSTNG